MIRRTDDGVLISAPSGEVLLKRGKECIVAEYHSGPLINGTATAFAEKAKRTALEYASKLEMPWTEDRDDGLKIHDHGVFYQQTFSNQTYALETLNRWTSQLSSVHF